MPGSSDRMSAEEMAEYVKQKLAEAEERKDEVGILEMPDTAALETYLQAQMPQVSGLVVRNLERISYGTAREHYSFDARWEQADTEVAHSYVLLRDHDLPQSVLPHYEVMSDPSFYWVQGKGDRQREFLTLTCLEELGVPAPHARWLDLTGAWLERPFTIHGRVAGQVAPSFTLLGLEEEGQRAAIAQQFVEVLAAIHHVPWQETRLASLGAPRVGTDEYASTAVECLDLRVAASCPEKHPALRVALSWLREKRPSLQTVALCHGDYKTDNFIFSGDRLLAVLDWEFAHLGDPAEDLGASCMGLHITNGLCMGLMAREKLLEAYERRAGRSVDRELVRFWEIFYDVRMTSFCYTMMAGAKEYIETAPELPPWFDEAAMETFWFSMVNRLLDDIELRLA